MVGKLSFPISLRSFAFHPCPQKDIIYFDCHKALIPQGFSLKNNLCEFTTRTLKFKRLISTGYSILNAGIKNSINTNYKNPPPTNKVNF